MTETTATATATATDATAITVVRLDVEGNATRAQWSPGPSGSLLELLQAAVGGDTSTWSACTRRWRCGCTTRACTPAS